MPFDLGYVVVFGWILLGLAIYLSLKRLSGPALEKCVNNMTKSIQVSINTNFIARAKQNNSLKIHLIENFIISSAANSLRSFLKE